MFILLFSVKKYPLQPLSNNISQVCLLYVGQKWEFKVKTYFNINMQVFSSRDKISWTGVVWIIVSFSFSFWRHPFTSEDLLVGKWCNTKFLQIYSNEETNCILNYEQIFIFGCYQQILL